MKIAIIGYGKMGNMIKKIAQKRGHKIVTTIDPENKSADYPQITENSVNQADICIEFTAPEAALKNFKSLLKLNKKVVSGTTGWLDNYEKVREITKKYNAAFLWGANFSPGMNIFHKIIDFSSKIIKKTNQYDVSGFEIHHTQKADSPSGTAKTLAETIKKNFDKKDILYDKSDKKINPDALHFSSLRCGSTPGTHKVIFDSDADTIELSHAARNREGFATGAVMAAEWLVDRKGFFNVTDFYNDLLT
ncbi:MAG: 4-hydroxy-tetrahydrodipicolinate reductase [Candidatus Muiribacteriota bacterium]